MILHDFPTCVPESNDKPLRAHTSLDKPLISLMTSHCWVDYALFCPILAIFRKILKIQGNTLINGVFLPNLRKMSKMHELGLMRDNLMT